MIINACRVFFQTCLCYFTIHYVGIGRSKHFSWTLLPCSGVILYLSLDMQYHSGTMRQHWILQKDRIFFAGLVIIFSHIRKNSIFRKDWIRQKKHHLSLSLSETMHQPIRLSPDRAEHPRVQAHQGVRADALQRHTPRVLHQRQEQRQLGRRRNQRQRTRRQRQRRWRRRRRRRRTSCRRRQHQL